MGKDDDIEIRYEGLLRGIIYLMVGVVVCGFAIFAILWPARGVNQNAAYLWIMRIIGLVGLGIITYGVLCIRDKGVRLTLNQEGLKNHRTGAFVKWVDFRGVRLFFETTNDITMAVTMYVKVPHGDGEKEVEFDVHSLNATPEQIAELVRKRGIGALEAAANTPEAMFAGMMANVTADLKGGIPLSFATNKLVKQGLDRGQAAKVVATAAAGEVIQCRKCRLDYHASVKSCNACGGALRA